MPIKRIHNWIRSIFDVGSWTFPTNCEIRCSLFFVLLAAVFVMGISGCGKKGMPAPPKAGSVPAVSDLSYEIQGGYVHLTWSLPAEVNKGGFGRGKMIVSRARTKVSDDACDDCPMVFQQVAVIPVAPGMGAVKHTHREALEPGFRYTYRVVLQMERGRTSDASNLVTFDY